MLRLFTIAKRTKFYNIESSRKPSELAPSAKRLAKPFGKSTNIESHMEVSRYADAKLLLPHVSVTAFTLDSTSKPAPRKQGYRRCQPPSYNPYKTTNKICIF